MRQLKRRFGGWFGGCDIRTLYAIVGLLFAQLAAFPQSTVIEATTSQYTFVQIRHSTAVTTDAYTIKNDSSNPRWVKIHALFVTCSSTCSVSTEYGGTAATTTCALVTKSQEGSSVTFLAKGCYTSNAGSGTEIGYIKATGSTAIPIPLTGMFTRLAARTAQQVTFRVVQASSGTIDYAIYGEEVNN